MDYEPDGIESVGSFVGFDSHRVKGDLESFKTFIESRGASMRVLLRRRNTHER